MGAGFKVCLHCENKDLITQNLVGVFKKIKSSLDGKFNNLIFRNDTVLAVEIPVSKNEINFAMNMLVKKSLNQLLKHFNLRDQTELSPKKRLLMKLEKSPQAFFADSRNRALRILGRFAFPPSAKKPTLLGQALIFSARAVLYFLPLK